jgi:uncharacterized metal-binding protein YceD (DUF177 family)
MKSPLLDRRTPREWYGDGPDYTLDASLAAFEKLCDAVAGEIGPSHDTSWRDGTVNVDVRLKPAEHRDGAYILTGDVTTVVPLVCQRCLSPFMQSLASEIDAELIAGEPASDAAGDREIWELDDETFRLIDVLDEALVMAIPMSPRHAPDTCGAAYLEEDAPPRNETIQPFADLKARMAKNETGD